MNSPKTVFRILLIIFAVALALRTTRCFLQDRIDKDAVYYLNMTRDAAAGDFERAFSWNTRIPPLYLFMTAGGTRLGLSPEAAGLLISVLAGALLVFPVFHLARKFTGNLAALISALMVATHPYLVRLSAEIMRDSLFLLLLFGALAAAVKATDEKHARWWYAAGFLSGLATLTRSEGNELLVALFVWSCWALVQAWRNRHCDGPSAEAPASSLPLRRTLLSAVAAPITFLAIYLLTTLPVQFALNDTPSSWSVIDTRIVSFVGTFLDREIDKTETKGGR
jgi:4-amino-4-deoxy-L-arabinose transferase-like glycosyltransferase